MRAAQVQLLDSPGIIPAKQAGRPVPSRRAAYRRQPSAAPVPCAGSQITQADAYHLAMCDDIGSASYDTQGVAAALLETMRLVAARAPLYVRLDQLSERLHRRRLGLSADLPLE